MFFFWLSFLFLNLTTVFYKIEINKLTHYKVYLFWSEEIDLESNFYRRLIFEYLWVTWYVYKMFVNRHPGNL